MKILAIHSDYIEFEPKQKAIKGAEAVEKEKKKIEDCLVIFSAAEKEDENLEEKISENTVEEIENIANQVKCNRIVLYPYVHLTSKPSRPITAQKILSSIEENLKKDGYEVYHAPFGWYKEFSIKCKGHPLAELSREIHADKKSIRGMHEEEKGSEKIIKGFLVVLPNGEIKDYKELDMSKYPKVKTIIDDELGEKVAKEGEPAHISIAKKLAIGEREPVADAGNLRFWPNGAFIKQLIRDLSWKKFVEENGAHPIGTPLVIRRDDPGVSWLANHFPERQYKVVPGKEDKNVDLFLRTAGDYTCFSIFRDATLSYKSMPIGLYEDELYDHRYEQRGELRGMYRIRCFEMHNIHTVAKDEEQAFEVFKKVFNSICEVFSNLEIKPDGFIFFVLEKMLNDNQKEYLKWLSKKYNTPIVIELLEDITVYMHAWIDFLVFDSLNRPMEIGTSQIDSFSTKEWNITFKDKDNTDKHPFMVHSGFGVERTIAAILEIAAREKNPTLPIWITPTQIRICPVNDNFIEYSEKIAEELEKNGIRVDIDDRSETIGKKIRNAEVEWIPYVIVIGEKEKESGKLAVRIRKTGEIKQMEIDELISEIKGKTKGMPFKKLPLNKFLSRRPVFV